MAKKKKEIIFINPLANFKKPKQKMSREDIENANLEIRRGIAEIDNTTENVHVGGFQI